MNERPLAITSILIASSNSYSTMNSTAITFDLDELSKCSDEHLRDFVRCYGGVEEAAIAFGEQLAANDDMHIDTTTIINWIVSRIGTDVATTG